MCNTIYNNLSKNWRTFQYLAKYNKGWFGYLLLVSIISYFSVLTNFSLTIDAETLVLSSTANLAWIQQGRWGMYLLNWVLLPNPVMPFIPLFLALLFTSLSFMLIAKLLARTKNYAYYLSAPIFISSPVLFYMFSFTTINYGIGFAFLLATLSVHFFAKNIRFSKIFSIFFAASSLGIYQIMICWLMVLFILYLLALIIQKEKLSIKYLAELIIKIVFVLASSFFIYFIIEHACYFLFKLKPLPYTSLFIKVSADIKYWVDTCYLVVNQMIKFYSGASIVYVYHCYSLFILLIAICIAIIFLIIRSKQSYGVKIFGFLLLLVIFIIPFVFNFINAGYMPPRTLFGVPLVISGLTFLSWQNKNKLFRVILISLVIVVSYNFIVINHKLAFTSSLSYEADKALSVRLLNHLDAVRPVFLSANEPIPFAVAGYHERLPSEYMQQKDTIGASFYSWDQGDVGRIVYLLNTLGVFEYKAATTEQQRSIMSTVSKMPVWPNKDSVAFINGIAVVKFGDYSYLQLVKLQISK